MEWWIWITRWFFWVSDIQDYIEYIVKKHETLATISPIHVYINRINNRLVFKAKHGYKLELQTPETRKLIGSIKNNRQNKKRIKCSMYWSRWSSFSPVKFSR